MPIMNVCIVGNLDTDPEINLKFCIVSQHAQNIRRKSMLKHPVGWKEPLKETEGFRILATEKFRKLWKTWVKLSQPLRELPMASLSQIKSDPLPWTLTR